MSSPEIVLIAAVAQENRLIGKAGELPWHISDDLKRMKRLTLGHPVIMGRKTFESILKRLGKPLPGRLNVVLTRSHSYPDYPDVRTYDSVENALKNLSNEFQIAILGGQAVYQKTLEFADRLELTLVEGNYAGDAYFPEYEHLVGESFIEVDREQHDGYAFVTYKKSSR